MKTTTVVCIARPGPVKAECQRLLAHAPGLTLAQTSTSLGDALELLNAHHPDVLVVDAVLLDEPAPGLIRAMQDQSPRTRILLITENMGQEALMPCLLAGAKGAVDTGHLEKFLRRAIQCLDRGESWISRRMVGLLLTRLLEYVRGTGAGVLPLTVTRGT